jgi:hypothetical protein
MLKEIYAKAKSIQQQISQHMIHGTGSDPKKPENRAAKYRTAFSRSLVNELFAKNEIKPYLTDDVVALRYDLVLSAIFAELLQAGNCLEYSAIAFFKLVESYSLHKQPNNGCPYVEIVNAKFVGQLDGHMFVMINRDAKKLRLADTSKWRNLVIFDTWPGSQKLIPCIKSAPTWGELIAQPPATLGVSLKSTDFTPEVWETTTRFLIDVENLITDEMLASISPQARSLGITAEQFKLKLREKIQLYTDNEEGYQDQKQNKQREGKEDKRPSRYEPRVFKGKQSSVPQETTPAPQPQ